MSKYNELVKKLKEIFQIDRPELDFGIYRILNAKADEINNYLENTLKQKISDALATAGNANKAELEKQLNSAIKAAEDAGFNPEDSPKVKDLRQQIITTSQGANEHENAVFTHLLSFFSRYYDSGDFVSKRRYKGDTYAIPYAGEEVMLHWANKDQYYIKSGENFSNYSFKLDDGRKVSFKLLSADTAKDNRKDNEADRRFVLIEPHMRTKFDDEGNEYDEEYQPVTVVKSEGTEELVIQFEYKAVKKGTKQNVLVTNALQTVLSHELVQSSWADITKREPTEKNPNRTLLEKHLTTYTQRNTADYFIHKDLGGFLSNELDFYIKNEVMNLDNVQNAEVFADIEKQLRMIQCLRSISKDIISFLSQLENFQKKLWTKKKFVIETNYCITLDKIDEQYFIEILQNKAQLLEWESTHEIQISSVNELKDNLNLVLDTVFYDTNFKYKLLSKFDNLDEQIDGVLINSENFGALSTLLPKYNGKVDLTYIDPPFNTGSDFLYKDNYQDSTWLTLMKNRFDIAEKLLSNTGTFYLHLDHRADYMGRILLNSTFKTNNFLNNIIWNYGSGGKSDKYFGRKHDTIMMYKKGENIFNADAVGIERGASKKNNMKKGVDEDGRKYVSIKSAGKIYKYYEDEKITPNDVWEISHLQQKDPERVAFNTQKPERLLERIVKASSNKSSFVLDFFSGSGSTINTAQKLNRKWIGVEMGAYFRPITLSRIKETISGKICGISKANEKENLLKKGGFFKYFKLESYEDTLNNLEIKKNQQTSDLFEMMNEGAKSDYLLNYMLETESKGSLLSTDDFKKPFDYKMKIAVDSAGASEEQNIDLVETFNYLIGLHVNTIESNLDRGYVRIEGTLPSGERALILWRDCDKWPYDKFNLETLKVRFDLNPKEKQFDVIYVNGDHNLPTAFTNDEDDVTRTLKLRQIEPEFLEQMFAPDELA